MYHAFIHFFRLGCAFFCNILSLLDRKYAILYFLCKDGNMNLLLFEKQVGMYKIQTQWAASLRLIEKRARALNKIFFIFLI